MPADEEAGWIVAGSGPRTFRARAGGRERAVPGSSAWDRAARSARVCECALTGWAGGRGGRYSAGTLFEKVAAST